MNQAELFNQTWNDALAAVIQRLERHADTLSIETAFTAGWQACLAFNTKAEVLARDEHSESAQKRHTAIRPGPEMCTVCGRNWVDSAAGFDTCEDCNRRI